MYTTKVSQAVPLIYGHILHSLLPTGTLQEKKKKKKKILIGNKNNPMGHAG